MEFLNISIHLIFRWQRNIIIISVISCTTGDVILSGCNYPHSLYFWDLSLLEVLNNFFQLSLLFGLSYFLLALDPAKLVRFLLSSTLLSILRLSGLFRLFIMFIKILYPSCVVICPPNASANFSKHFPICRIKGSNAQILLFHFVFQNFQLIFVSGCLFWFC